MVELIKIMLRLYSRAKEGDSCGNNTVASIRR